jgi:cytochrome c553
MKKVCLLMALCISMMSVGCGAPEPQFKSIGTTQDVMESVIAHMAQEIWNSVSIEIDASGTKENKPQNKEEWQEVGFIARGLAESASLLLYEGRLEDEGDWKKFTEQLQTTAMEAAKAADDQDPEALLTAGGNIYEVCTKCHEAYLEKVEMKRTGGKPEEAPSPAPGAPAK